MRNARRANTKQAETAVTPHVSAEVVALAGTNRVVIGTEIVGLGRGHYVSTGVSFINEVVIGTGRGRITPK